MPSPTRPGSGRRRGGGLAERTSQQRAQAEGQPTESSAGAAQQQPVGLAAWLGDPGQQAEIQRALPAGVSVERFVRMVMTQARQVPNLMACTRSSILAAVLNAAQLNLEPGPLGHVYLIPFRNGALSERAGQDVYEVQFLVGYKGYIDLALRSDRIDSIDAETVYDDDEFDFAQGSDTFLHHKKSLTPRADRRPLCWYAIVHYRGGGFKFVVVPRQEVERHRERGNKNSPAWRNDYDAMARKTAIRILVPFLPMSAEALDGMARAIATDEKVVIDVKPGDVPETHDYEPDPPAPPAHDQDQDAGAVADEPAEVETPEHDPDAGPEPAEDAEPDEPAEEEPAEEEPAEEPAEEEPAEEEPAEDENAEEEPAEEEPAENVDEDAKPVLDARAQARAARERQERDEDADGQLELGEDPADGAAD